MNTKEYEYEGTEDARDCGFSVAGGLSKWIRSSAPRCGLHLKPTSQHAVQAFTHGVRRQLVGTGVRIGEVAPGVVLNELWGIAENASTESSIEQAQGITSEDVADAVLYMLTRPRHVNIRDLVILPTSQEI